MNEPEPDDELRVTSGCDVSTDGPFGSVTDFGHWQLVFHTARNMTATQLGGIAERKMRHAVLPRVPVDFDERYERKIPAELVPNTGSIERNSSKLRGSLTASARQSYRSRFEETLVGTFTFLNRTIDFEDGIDWQHEKLYEYPLLWRLKLHSFEHLEWFVLGYDPDTTDRGPGDSFDDQLRSWANTNPIGERKYLRRSWIPHAVSLRILNWIRYAAWSERSGSETVQRQLYDEIYKNALFLSNHVEYEIGGNHLIENAIALIVAGVFFERHETGWIQRGLDILRQVGETQFMSDGGHFERSPMYHIQVLRRYITAYDLLSESGPPTPRIKGIIERALGFLVEISKPNGRIPLLNDSVYRAQIEAGTCLEYGAACGLKPREISLDSPGGSGYRTLRSDAGTLLFDVGEVGPPHLPAHSHNDQLSVLVWVGDAPLLTDTGVFDYARNRRRQFARSVRAHNTAQYGDIEPIPIGGSYLMGRRTGIETEFHNDQTIWATYERTGLVGPTYEYKRTVTATSDGWRINDVIDSEREATVTVRYHFHPEIDLIEGPTGEYEAYRAGKKLASLRFENHCDRRRTTSTYFPRYGTERRRPMVAVIGSTGTEILTEIDVSGDEHGPPNNSLTTD